ncbi:ARPP-1 family domain-containing protein [Nocardioides yefusunii]|uniref:ARPP-1 family domain-containing protein n=1 Tax=Nocardioides yefusunii TaxID=2500546 RepID=A0ABW1R3X0_9ACTN|nr:DUF6569 family protein [Nocardioides yefusunii]
MLNVHVGQGTTRGALTVFPLWKEGAGFARHTLATDHLEIAETEGSPRVDTLVVGNPGDRPTLILEGQLFEGGWQHRMATRPVVVGVHQTLEIDVACVEQGRWTGATEQNSRGRRVTPWIRESVRSGGNVQQEVWDRVAQRTAGTDNPTRSFVRRLDSEHGSDWSDLRPLQGQTGILVGLAGQPLMAEMFATSTDLRQQMPSILDAVSIDAAALQDSGALLQSTPERRAVRFVHRFTQVQRSGLRQAGVGVEESGRSQYLDASVVRLQNTPVHVRMSNVRHPLLAGV